MIPQAFYGFLLSSFIGSWTISALVFALTGGEFQLWWLFIFVVLFPIAWKVGKKYFPRENTTEWNKIKKWFWTAIILGNILMIIIFMIASTIGGEALMKKGKYPIPTSENNTTVPTSFADL